MFPRLGAGATLPSGAAGEGQGQLSHSYDLKARSPACHRQQRAREVGEHVSLPAPPHHRTTVWYERQVQISHAHLPGASDPSPLSIVSSPVLPKQGAGPTFPRAAAGKGSVGSLVPVTGGSGKEGQLSLTLTTLDMEGVASYPTLSHTQGHITQG